MINDPVGKAVDGAVFYALKAVRSKEYSVALALATSGESEEEMKVSLIKVFMKDDVETIEFLCYPGGKPIDRLISLGKILEFVFPSTIEKQKKIDNKVRTDIHGLMRKAAVSEENKALVLAGSLLALKDQRFYKRYTDYEGIALGVDALSSADNYIKKQGLLKDLKKRESFLTPFNVIEAHQQLHISDQNDAKMTPYRQMLDVLVKSSVLDSIDPDVIGDFYTEFLRYSGGDGKGLGIVLTPHHITDLFTELAYVTERSVVIDTCSGTGSFLNSALHKAITTVNTLGKAENETAESIKKFKTKSIVGVEKDPKMFSLGATNLLLRGVRIDHLFEGSCFDEEIITSITGMDQHPDVALINPPYSLRKDGGKSEIEFIENACSLLSAGGFVVALVPVSTGGETIAVSTVVKERILKGNTLWAVMSLPGNLFAGSAGTIVQILVFKVGEPHINKSGITNETWFANWTDDGFLLKKHVGRADYNGLWKERKKKWVKDYTTRSNAPGHSVLKAVTHADEWVTEAYLETDYTKLTSSHFEKKLKDFALYALANDVKIPKDLKVLEATGEDNESN